MIAPSPAPLPGPTDAPPTPTPVGRDELAAVLADLHADTRDDHFLALQEGYFKVCVMRTLLRAGHRLQEGAPIAGVAWFAEDRGDLVPAWTRARRRVTCDGGSSDVVAIRDGVARQFELKTRSDHGSKSGAATGELLADFERVAGRDGFVFLAAFDEGIYRSFSGAKVERRGRKAANPGMTAMFVPIDRLRSGRIEWSTHAVGAGALEFAALRQDLPGGARRVLVIGARAPAPEAARPADR